MKIAWLIAPLLLLLTDRGGSVSAEEPAAGGLRKLHDYNGTLITDAKGFKDAILSASDDPMNPSKIKVDVNSDIGRRKLASSPLVKNTKGFMDAVLYYSTIMVDVNAVIDFDGNMIETWSSGSYKYYPMVPGGIFVHYRDLDFICVGYNETNKCTLKRSDGRLGGRFFRILGPAVVSFTGFQFIGGNSENAPSSYFFHRSGGAFVLGVSEYFVHAGDDREPEVKATFIDCDFINNRSPQGARGGAIYALSDDNHSNINLIIRGCFFQDNLAGDAGNETKGNDIARSSTGNAKLSCSETTSAPGTEVDVAWNGNTCSATAVPTASPSAAPSRFQGWQTITYDNFEDKTTHDGWGNFKTYTKDVKWTRRRTTSGDDFYANYVPNGYASILIENDEGRESSIYHRKSHDVRIYSKLRVSFWYKTDQLENSDSIVLEYSKSDGNWKMMHRFNKKNWENRELKQRTIDFDETDKNYELTSEARIRIRCDHGRQYGYIYVDEVHFEGYYEGDG